MSGKLELPRRLDPRDAEGELGGDVDDVGPEAARSSTTSRMPRERPLDVADRGRAGRWASGAPRAGRVGRAAAGRWRCRPGRSWPRACKRVGEPQQGHADPAHHRPVDLGEERDPHGWKLGGRALKGFLRLRRRSRAGGRAGGAGGRAGGRADRRIVEPVSGSSHRAPIPYSPHPHILPSPVLILPSTPPPDRAGRHAGPGSPRQRGRPGSPRTWWRRR